MAGECTPETHAEGEWRMHAQMAGQRVGHILRQRQRFKCMRQGACAAAHDQNHLVMMACQDLGSGLMGEFISII
eukprot:scaffold41908_cov24-Tisochrysis_lutea.AAC.1